jgi:Flp pilus assembly protein TadD
MYSEAIASFQKAVDLSRTSEATEGKPEMMAALGHALALGGKKSEAKAAIDKLTKPADSKYVSSYGVSLIYIALGDNQNANQWLERAYQERDENFIHLKVDPRLDPIRGEPRFQELLQRLNLR